MVSLYVVVILILLLCFYLIKKNLGPINSTVCKGYTQPKDTVKTMLDRIQWSNHHQGRLSYAPRYMLYSIFITLAASMIFLNKLPSPVVFLQMMIVTWLALMSLHSYFSHHGDKFSSYAIDQNVNNIRTELGYSNTLGELSEQTEKFAGHEDCFTFTYEGA